MLEEFSYLGEEMARKVVIDNPVMISEKIEKIKPIPDGTFTPEIPGANDELVEITPKNIRLRKKILDPTARYRAKRNGQS